LEKFTDDVWADFTKTTMNGREIKNAVKLAYLLAISKETALVPKHVYEVLEALHESVWEESSELVNNERKRKRTSP